MSVQPLQRGKDDLDRIIDEITAHLDKTRDPTNDGPLALKLIIKLCEAVDATRKLPALQGATMHCSFCGKSQFEVPRLIAERVCPRAGDRARNAGPSR